MAIGGPRLDRPSAIGEEGRARAASLWLATIVIVGLVGVGGVALGEPSLLVSLATVVGMAVAGIGLLERDQQGFATLFGSHALLVGFGSATALLVVIAPIVTREGIAVSGFALALLGIGISWANVGSDGLQRSVEGVTVTYASMLCTALVTAATLAVGVVGWRGLVALVGERSPLLSLGGFLVVVIVTASTTLLAGRWLPLVALTRRDRRPTMRRATAATHRILLWIILVALAGVVVLVGVGLSGWPAMALADRSGVGAALVALSSWYVLAPLLAVAVGSLFAGLVAVVLRRLTRRTAPDATRRTAALVVGVVIVALTPIGFLLLLVSPLVAWLLALVVGIGPLVFIILGGGGVLAGWGGLLPDRSGGPAIAATGLVIAAIGLGMHSPVLVFACIAGAVLVWDLATFGLGVTGELGHLPETRRLELFHGVVAVAVGGGAVLVTIGLETLRTGAFAGVGGTSALALVAVGALVLLLPLRG